jgi:antitoxin component YwqK of YwqJK toxin-antitoxin module
MDCEFIKTLSEEQREMLRKALEKDSTPKYSVEFETWSNGRLKEVIEYEGDNRHGRCQVWHPDGKRNVDCTYAYGERDGRYRSWYSNGNQSMDCTYVSGKLHGRLQRWYPDGRLEEDRIYENGVRTT